ncbi:16S rRNA (cytosine(1402)-N(4))-methyltransferase RsmH [Anaerobiospirillum sp. NML120448]|uniref:16S rRNA (cytosine(1402)-N(4))-methyltransferase RsmH n=1 Tax=Anaerobiospirillum sp. NML120448 TaxID=2932816 RepID=UPI001FF17F01|nr:16S rRNA (cytosine(1402)-N(4))-methyltransferase RsmH [Anaerobiospirillum sp. NML120448]MCK0514297.1 16S rRNA (cytosine(1402)-N(4))-methyltransferase RsmH [Anaerobiospirillum sp. NML120448]
MATFSHIPVLLHECIEGLNIKADGVYIDGTFGRGGHSRQILASLGSNGRLIGLDRDLSAIEVGKELEKEDPRFTIVHTPFSRLSEVCQELDLVGKVDGILLDIGVSSPQLDDGSRGFSFDKDGPLDMRMDQSAPKSAQSVIASYDVKQLAYIFKVYGEERFANQVARAIVRRRENEPFTSTKDLANVIAGAIPGKPTPKHKATRCFQALRIEVNSELEELKTALQGAVEVLAPQGRLCVISFHSLEDRIVKTFFKESSQGQKVPSVVPLTSEELDRIRLQTATLDLIGGAIKATDAEIEANVRSRSATLRVAQRLCKGE